MTVQFRAKALDDVNSIYRYRMTEHSAEVAAHVEAGIFATTKMLCRHPEFGTKTDHTFVRRWPMMEYDYTIFYLIDWKDEALDILRVVDGRRVRNLRKVP